MLLQDQEFLDFYTKGLTLSNPVSLSFTDYQSNDYSANGGRTSFEVLWFGGDRNTTPATFTITGGQGIHSSGTIRFFENQNDQVIANRIKNGIKERIGALDDGFQIYDLILDTNEFEKLGARISSGDIAGAGLSTLQIGGQLAALTGTAVKVFTIGGKSGQIVRAWEASDDIEDVLFASKPGLPAPKANPAYSWPGHRNAALAEAQLAQTIQSLTDEVVISYGDVIGTHGADVVSVNMNTGRVTLWDSKFRSSAVSIQGSTTFAPGSSPLQNAVNKAMKEIGNNTNIPPAIRDIAIRNLQSNQYRTRTVGMGAAKNSVIR